MSSFSDWVLANWPVKLDIIKGDFGGAPNEDERVANYSITPALLFDEFDDSYYIRYPGEWRNLGAGGFGSGGGSIDFDSFEAGQGISIQRSYGIEGETQTLRIESEGLLKATRKSKELSSLLEILEGDYLPSFPALGDEPTTIREVNTVEKWNSLIESDGISFPHTKASHQEKEKTWLLEGGGVSISNSDKGSNTLIDKVETDSYGFPYTSALSEEEDELWLLESGGVRASESDRGAATLFNKLQAGEGLSISREKGNALEPGERIRLGFDDETREIFYDLKYEKYTRETEQNRSNDVYVDVKTAPYQSIRDGSKDRPYLSIKDAVESEQVQKGECTIWVMSGIYIEEAPITLPSGTSIVGSELRRVRVFPTTDTCGATYDKYGGGTLLFELTFNCILRNMTIRGVVAPGFVLGYRKDANLKTISPYIQNCTAYNDGRDVHQLFAKEVTKLKGALLPNTTEFKETVEVKNGTIFIDEESNPTLRLASGERYKFEIKNGNNQFIRFTTDLSNYNQTDIVDDQGNEIALEEGFTSYLDLTYISSISEELYYVLIPDSIENASYGKVKIVPPDLYKDKFVLRPGNKVNELEVDPVPLNFERGDPIWVGDPKEFPFSYLDQSIYSEKTYTTLKVKEIDVPLESGKSIYVYNGKVAKEIVLTAPALAGDNVISIESLTTRYDFGTGASIHFQHPLFTEKFILREDAPKGSTLLKFATFQTIGRSYSIPYQLTGTFEEPPNDEINLIEELDRDYKIDEELWLLETDNDRDTTNLYPAKVKRAAGIGTKLLPVTDSYIKPSERDLAKVMTLRPLSGEEPLEEELPICNSYIRAGSVVRKDPWRRRNGGGGAHVNGFRLRKETRLSNNPPDSRTMCFNDFTQLNVNGYGILTEGIANSECVSVFTYFCNNSLYAKNGGEIRGLNCSSAFGVYGLKAEGYLGVNSERSDENTPEITAERIWLGYTYTQELANNNQDPLPIEGEIQTQIAVIENPKYNPSVEDRDATPTVGSLIKVSNTGIVGIIEATRYVRSNFQKDVLVVIRIAGSWLSLNSSTPSIVEPLGDLNDINNVTGVYEFRSAVRVTGHDFGYVGTGTRLPRNVGGSGFPLPDKEVRTLDFGQVFWSASDQLGNFTVGEFFRVEAQTGSVSFNTDQFDLTGLSELGPFRDPVKGSIGTVIREISADPQLNSDRDGQGENPGPNTIPTQTAVRSYVDQRVGAIIDLKVTYISNTQVLIGKSGEVYPSLQVFRGLTYRFDLSTDPGVSSSPFYIVNKDNIPLSTDQGVTNNGASVGSILYKVPLNETEDRYYRISEQGIAGLATDNSTLYVTNPDIEFPSGNPGEIQYVGTDSEGNRTFSSTENLRMQGSTLVGTFEGIFSGDGQFLSNIRVRQDLQDLEDVDLGVSSQIEPGDSLTYFLGTKGVEGYEKSGFRLARGFLPVKTIDGNTMSLPLSYNYKEETPIADFISGKLDFSNLQASQYISLF